MTPTCHRTLYTTKHGTTAGSPCIGSGCALFVPQYVTIRGDRSAGRGFERTGKGGCADNPGRLWADPAEALE